MEYEPVEEERKPEFPEAELSDEAAEEIFGLNQEDILGEGDADMKDLFEVTNEDIMGRDPLKLRSRKFKRTGKRYVPPPNTSLGGMRL